MASDSRPGARALALAVALAASLGFAPTLCRAADDKARPTIFSCVDATGKRITADRPIPECAGKPLNSLNTDGSLRAVVPPPLTVEERERKEVQEREAEAKEQAYKQLVRADRNLMQLYPSEAAHKNARKKALADFDASVGKLQKRILELVKERKPLLDEAEFYSEGKLPPKIRQALDANDASLKAQRELVEGQQAEVVRINATYDIELARLKKLWSGAAPGSMGPMPGPQAAQSAPVTIKAEAGAKPSPK